MLKEQFNAMHSAWQNRNFNGLLEQIHNLQTTACTLGHDAIRDLTTRLETLVATHDADGVESIMEELAVGLESRALECAHFARSAAAASPTSGASQVGVLSSAACGNSDGGPLVSSLPMSDPEFRRITQGFVVRLRQEAEALRTACEKDDLTEIRRLAHWLRGAAGTMGFAPLTEPASMLEQWAKEGLAEEAKTTVALISAMVDSIEVPPPDAPLSANLPEALCHE